MKVICKGCRSVVDMAIGIPASLSCQKCGAGKVSFEGAVRLQRFDGIKILDERTVAKNEPFDAVYRRDDGMSFSIWTITPLIEEKKEDLAPTFIPIEEEKKKEPEVAKSQGIRLRLKGR